MYSDIQYTSLTLDKNQIGLTYRTLFYVNVYGSYKDQSGFFGPPCECKEQTRLFRAETMSSDSG